MRYINLRFTYLLTFQFHGHTTACATTVARVVARHSTSSIASQLCATKPSRTHAIARRDVIYRPTRRRLTCAHALTRATSSDGGRPHAAAAVRDVADYTFPRRHGLLRRVLPLPLPLADAYVTQRVNCSPTRSAARAKPGDVQSFCCDAYSLPAAHTNKTCVNNTLIMR